MQPAPSDNVLLFIYYLIFYLQMQTQYRIILQKFKFSSFFHFRYNAIIIPGDIICSVEKDCIKSNWKLNAIQNNERKVHWEWTKKYYKMHLQFWYEIMHSGALEL